MAEVPVTGDDMYLFIDLSGGTTNYDTVVCLTSKSIKRTTSVIDAATQCGPYKLPGAQDVTVDFEGNFMLDPAANRISSSHLHDAWADKRSISWKVAKGVPGDGDVSYTGKGFISDLTDTFGGADPSKFSATIAVQGSISRFVEGS